MDFGLGCLLKITQYTTHPHMQMIDQQEKIPSPAHILFVLKQRDPEINQIMLELVAHLSKCPMIKLYFTDQDCRSIATAKFPGLESWLYSIAQYQLIINYVITVGGDGTILFGNKLFQSKSTPDFVSFEMGTLGFMCKFKLELIETFCLELIGATMSGGKLQCKTQSRMRLTCTKVTPNCSADKKYQCLNEVAINKFDNQSQLRLEIFIGDQLFTTTSGDGILISTPTGSTAYALSAGGPIIHNQVRTILIVPICPKSLSFRPICLPAYVNLRVRLAQSCKVSAFVCCDGQSSYQMGRSDEIHISQSLFDFVSLSPNADNNFEQWSKKLNNLLTWNAGFQVTGSNDLPQFMVEREQCLL